MAEGCINEYVYSLPELYQLKSDLTPGLYWVQGCISGRRKVVSEDDLGPANINSRVGVSSTQLIGFWQELKFSKRKHRALEGQLRSTEVKINVGNDDQQLQI